MANLTLDPDAYERGFAAGLLNDRKMPAEIAADPIKSWSWSSGRIEGEAARTTDNMTPDEAAGIAWWNTRTPSERARWLSVAGSAAPADAWAAFKRGIS